MLQLFNRYFKFYQNEDQVRMDSRSSDFISQFHNLEGDLIGERKKNFSKLLRNTTFSSEVQLNLTLENLHPKSYQESLFHIDALIYYRKTRDLIKILQEGNEVFISKILKQSWFFKEAFKDINPEIFVNEFLPCLSYVIRLKILKKLSECWHEDKIDELFDSINKRYGLYVATRVFHACTSGKIEEFLSNYEVRLLPGQVKHIYNRSQGLFMKYLDYLQDRCLDTYRDKKVLNHLAAADLEMLLNLEKNKKVTVLRKSKKMSRRILHLFRDEISQNLEYYIQILHHRTFVRKLGKDFKIIYQQLFAESFNSFDPHANYFKLLLHYYISDRWDLFSQTFCEYFPNKNAEDLLDSIDYDSLMKLQPEIEIIHKWAKIKYDKTHNDDMLVYFNTIQCFSIIKDRIEVTSDKNTRLNLVKILLRNCSRWHDLDTLENVLESICSRHRNEDLWFREIVFEEIHKNFCLDEFNEKHWKHIYEQIKIMMVKKMMYFGEWTFLLEMYIKFLAKNGLDLKDPLMEFISYKIKVDGMIYIDKTGDPIGQKIMVEAWKLLPEIHIHGQEERFLQTELIKGIVYFSLEHPHYYIRLSDLSHAVDIIQRSFTKLDCFDDNDLTIIEYVFQYNLVFPEAAVPIEETKVLDMLLQITEQLGTISYFKNSIKRLMKKNRSNLENSMLHLYFDQLYGAYPPTHDISFWYLKNEPRIVIPYLDTIFGISVSCWVYLDISSIKQFKQYSHLGFDRKLSDFYKRILIENQDVEWKLEAGILEKLSILLPAEEFVAYASDFFPPKRWEESSDEEKKHTLKLQQEIVKVLHKVIEPTKMLPLMIKIWQGENFQLASKALYSLLYRTIENELYHFTDVLFNQVVSVKKHALYLNCGVLEQSYVMNSILNTKENDIHFQKRLYSVALKVVLKSPTEELFSYVKENFPKIVIPEDIILPRNIRIPVSYQTAYIRKFSSFFKSIGQIGVNKENYLKYLSTDVLRSLPQPLIEDLIIWALKGKNRLPDFFNFILRLLQCSEFNSTSFFKKAFENLVKQDEHYIQHFFQHFLQIAYKKEISRNFVNTYIENWERYFAILDFFQEHIALDLLVLYLDTDTTEKYAENIALCLEKLLSEFGYLVFDLFESQLKRAMEYIENFDHYTFYQNILKYKCTAETSILLLELMEHSFNQSNNKNINQVHYDIIEKVRQMNEPMVQICLRKNVYSTFR